MLSKPQTPDDRVTLLRDVSVIAGAFLVVVVSLTAVTGLSMRMQSAVRAYVNGEGLWSKGQKDALHALVRYADHGDEADWAQFEAEIAVPLGDHAARLELEKPRPDREVVRRGFVAGRNDPRDVDDMAMLFRNYRHTAVMSRAIAIWTRGDEEIAEQVRLATALRREITSGHPRPQAVRDILDELDALNVRVSALERDFSSTLGAGARWVRGLFALLSWIAAGLLMLIATSFSWIMLGRMRRADLALRDSEQRYRTLVDNLREVIFQTDAHLRWTFLNPAWQEITGRDVEACLEQPLIDHVHPEDRDAARLAFASLLGRERDDCRFELRFLTKDGSVRWMQAHARLVPGDGGVPAGLAGSLVDITERHAAEEALRASEEQLRQSQKMEAIGQLAGGIAHDFNNLLTGILGYGSQLVKGLPEGHVQRAEAEEIVHAAEAAAGLTRQLLAFSRRQLLAPQVLDLNGVVGGMQGMLRRVIGEDIHLVTVQGQDLGHVRADRGQIEQVILNLAVNARDAMPQGGDLVLETANVDLDAAYAQERPPLVPGAYVRLTVRDTGVGMEEDTARRAFEPFFTTKAMGQGTGLGLSTVHGIVLQSGGHIEIQTARGTGTAIRIDLPRVNQAVTTEAHDAPAPHETRGTETVLLAEDEPVVRRLAGDTLRGLGYTVLESRDGVEAVQVAADHLGPIHLLVMDVVMPRLGGPIAASRIAAMRPRVRVLFITGYANDALGTEGTLDPHDAVLHKPFTSEALALKVRDVLARPVAERA
ncbi:MAG TPA: PAS domain S-box protein [Candidatus Saccharimonadaceae bacterium]|jgi:PAS domain S-box-containing protein|nr:PAS domain S-box protein [Candidatus Saccharimonadaceae bacterium]